MFVASLGVPLVIKIEVEYDADANVYVATSSSVRGLVVEASTLDQIRSEVEAALPELLEINHQSANTKHHTRLQFNT
jgi:hypothetical protein